MRSGLPVKEKRKTFMFSATFPIEIQVTIICARRSFILFHVLNSFLLHLCPVETCRGVYETLRCVDGGVHLLFSGCLKRVLHRAVYVAVGRVGSTTDSITQHFRLATDSSKQGKLALLLDVLAAEMPIKSVIVFVQKKRTAEWVCRALQTSLRVRAVEIHGDRSQSQREAALSDFRTGGAQVLVATDVAARGLDIPSVEHGIVTSTTNLTRAF